MNRNRLMVAGVIVGVIGLALVWYLASPLFIDNQVDEAFPLDLPTVEEADGMTMDELEAAVSNAMSEIDSLSDAEMAQVETRLLALAAQMPDDEMNEPMALSSEPVILSQGQFVGADSFHLGEGSATIYTLSDGQNVLRFEEFMVTNGPDLHVILSKHPVPTNRTEVGEDYLDLGPLKGNIGNQNYDIPANVNLSEYQSVVIYCMPFHVVFSTATLGS